jgi:protein tyrosine phosphatase (PTP) superfamily phosphohydrolase (DUF442 family)
MRSAIVSFALIAACGSPAEEAPSAPTATTGDEAPESAAEASAAPERSTDPETLGLVHAHRLESGLVTSGQPDLAALEAARDRGVRTIVSLQSPDEPGAAAEREMVEALGMRFISIPVASDEEITEENSLRVNAAIEDDATTILHCGSSNRAGAMVALRAFFEDGRTIEDAVALGRTAGLSRSEAAVTALLRQACLEDPVRETC